MSPEAPFARYTDEVRPEWIDYSDHMNMGFYLPAFELAAVCFFSVVDISEGYLAAVNQILYFHVDLERRRAAPFPDDAQARIDAWCEAHASLPRPP